MKILLAVDGSKYGRWATEWIAAMPFATAPQVKALHVLDLAALKAPFLVQPAVAGTHRLIQKEVTRLQQRAKKVATDTTDLLATLHLQGKVAIVKGAAAPTIIKAAPTRNGLIVIGSRGLSPIDRFMLGSVSTRVTTHVACSVLVVKQPSRPIVRLLLAIDGSKSAERAIQFIARELEPGKGGAAPEIAVTHVIPFLRYPELKEAGQAMVHDAAQTLAKAGYRTTEIVQLGDPADQLMKIAARQKADLIVTGAKGLGAVARFLLGSVSTKLVHLSPCSVLVVR
jgi:nucleotide-binding universal stress UspA family protein